jgi:hypothetical protein
MKTLCSMSGCDGVALARGWCNRHYRRWQKWGDPLATAASVKRVERFLAKVEVDECWLWVGKKVHGYGRFYVGNGDDRQVGAHRFAYELWVGPIPEGMEIEHSCHTGDPGCEGGFDCAHRACVNPDHLTLVTPELNASLKVESRRSRTTHCAQGHLFDDVNTRIRRGTRECRECGRIRSRVQRSGPSTNQCCYAEVIP